MPFTSMTPSEKELVNKMSKNAKSEGKILSQSVFGGNNFVFWMGFKNQFWRAFGGDKPSRLIVSGIMINFPSIFFYIFVVPKIIENMTPFAIVVYALLQIISTILMLATALMDPGVIPKNYYDRHSLHQLDRKYHRLKSY